ncbi:NrfD/PsrC family molybdoenzyme membrane anchor subunit [Thioclava atlantica]|uniref:Tetrathionate reductase subunit C n=1 Tax=Thioclava atlantica TaxID=1317124 RepID=A0A085TZI3_9RHOB|nr:NrfD/PsrC family molybdoenzyme membrane anchor subunit [Thioclava atlantica]KFE36130.1 tetrathionate reductase subunit C [Thioclava atlantica]
MQSIELIAPRYGIAWYPWAVQYFFLIALSYASLWLAVPGVIFGRENWKAAGRLALLGAVSTAIVAPITLLADLHQPMRFWHFYAYPNPTSWMALGSFFLPLYVGAVVVLGWLVWRNPMRAHANAGGVQGWLARIVPLGQWETPRWAVVLVGLAAVVFSLGVMIYTGAEVAILKARPLWHTEYLPAMFLITGLIGAAGLVVVLNRFSGLRHPRAGDQMLTVILVSLVLAGLVVAGWLAQGLTMNEGSVAAAIDSVRNNPDWRGLAYWNVVVGVVLFLGAGLMEIFGSLRGTRWILGLLALHVAWMFRWTVLMEVQTVARNSAGFQHYAIDPGSQGILGIVGSFGLWLAVVLIINMFVPWRTALGGRDEAEIPSAVQGEPNYG